MHSAVPAPAAQDHGPINTWDRQLYFMPPSGQSTPEWLRVVGNLIINGPSGNRDLGNLVPAVDNDDGSAYYWIAGNVVYAGGFKNYLGHDKVCVKAGRVTAVLLPSRSNVLSLTGAPEL